MTENTYLDDILFEAFTVEDTRIDRDQIRSLTDRGGFIFREWIANDSTLVSALPVDLRDPSLSREFSIDESRKVLRVS